MCGKLLNKVMWKYGKWKKALQAKGLHINVGKTYIKTYIYQGYMLSPNGLNFKEAQVQFLYLEKKGKKFHFISRPLQNFKY